MSSSFLISNIKTTSHPAGISARVTYKVIARVEMAINYTISTKTHLRVHQIPKPPKIVEGETSSRGLNRMYMKASLDKHLYYPGEQALLKCEFNNLSTADIKVWKVSLVEYLDLKFEGQRLSPSVSLFQESFEGFVQFYYGQRIFPFSVPTTIAPTLLTELIQNKYMLRIDAESSFGQSLEIALPLYVGHSDSAECPTAKLSMKAIEILHRPKWQNENHTIACAVCLEQFGMLQRKHHCRYCGNVVCSACSRSEIPLPQLGFTEAVRICDKCVIRAKEGEMGFHTPSRYLEHISS